ncbi:MAG: hypothetical protein IRZ21_05185 [Thermoleophilaceae bacterium]|nr:hypothetical protein [Thermoleophilaceae bacterium]
MRIPRTRGGLTGLIVMVLGLWAALIPFVGPYFNYSIHNDETWFWMVDRLWLEILPGAAAFFGGLLLMTSAFRASARTGALLAALGGIWLVIGPTTSMLWNHGSIDVGPALFGSFRRTIEWLGMFYLVGAIITALSSYAYGMLTARPVAARATAAGYGAGRSETEREHAAAGTGTTAPR